MNKKKAKNKVTINPKKMVRCCGEPNNKLYLVMGVEKTHLVNIQTFTGPLEVDLQLSWASNMLGVCPVFDSLEAAEKYAGGALQIQEVELSNG